MSEQRNIKTIAPFLADHFIDMDKPIFDRLKYSVFLNDNLDRLENLRKYLIGKLHDSRIADFKIKPDKLKMTLNDFSTHVFADAVVEKFKIDIDHDKLVFPVVLELSGNPNVEFYRVVENGDLESIDQISVDEYLGEQILKLSADRFEIAFELWNSNANDELHGERVLLIVSANELKLKEEQDKAWNDIFGRKYEGFYQYFREQFESDRYVSDYSECLKLVEEFERITKKKQSVSRRRGS